MSVTRNTTTQYHETAQDVKYKLNWLRLDNITNLAKLSIRGGLVGTVGASAGIVDKAEACITLADIQANCTATEKGKLKAAIAILERELAKAVAELAGEAHDQTDVFEI